MCGLVGVAGDLSGPDIKVFNNLLYFDYVRGSHSTGIASVPMHGAAEPTLLKAATDPLGLMGFKAYDTAVTPYKRIIMGHNRHATKGAVNRVNSHPFHVGNILGAHNGTLDYSCLRDLENAPEGETDSEQLVATINALGGDIAGALALTSGAWALTIYKAEDNSINFVRNSQRPLYYAFNESRKALYWASEAWMLSVALTRNDIKFSKIMEVPVDTILSWGIPKLNQTFADKPTREKAEGKKAANFRTHGQGAPWMDWGREDDNSRQFDRRTAQTSGGNESKKLTSDNKEVVDVNDDDEGWGAYYEGFMAGETGRPRADNPYDHAKQGLHWEQWRDGWVAGDAADVKAKNSKNKDKEKKDIVKPSDNNVVLFSEKKEAPSSSVRRGPGGNYINAGKFRELTGNECGWCNNPITFADKGFFMQHAAKTIFICETHGCATDKTLQQM